MPVSPALAENIAANVVEMYAQAERILLARIAKYLAKGIEAPDWAERKLLEVQFLQAQTRRLIADLGNRAAAQVAADLIMAYNRGGASAVVDLAALLEISLEEASTALAGLPVVEVLVSETVTALNATGLRILRATEDAYRSIVSETTAQVLLGTQTRREAAQEALNRFAKKGITGFVDKAGRGWNLTSYTEMAMRTGCGHAAIQGHTDRLLANGLDLVIGSDAPRECPLCAPWEGKVMSISGRTPGYPTLAEARAAGWQHCNCRHSVSLYQPGITRPHDETADPEGYAASQKLRYLERQTRQSKRLLSVAMDDAAQAKAQKRVRDYQAKIRAHVTTTTAKRSPVRERLGPL